MRHTKIVCTLGPAVAGYDRIKRLVATGMDVARLNFSHGEPESHRESYQHVRRASEELGKPVAILADLCGPKIRLGDLEGGAVTLCDGAELLITTEPVLGTAERVSTNFADLANDLSPGRAIYADDGRLEFRVEETTATTVRCRVVQGGRLRSRKGLNIPHAGLSAPTLTDKDRSDLAFARGLGVDYFALSFVRTPEDVLEAKRLAGDVPVIAKIEKPEAIKVLAPIADAADGLMVARGDLGVEVGFEKVPLLQKKMIRVMNQRAKPVITATQMLESMVNEPRPTRAEVSDVANAVLDGTDAVMLSAESAAGRFPFEAVRAMARIIEEVERGAPAELHGPPARVAAPSFSNAIAHSVARSAIDLDLPAVAVYSETGRSVALVSAYRPSTAIAGFSRDPRVVARMALYRGVVPIAGARPDSTDAVVEQVERELVRLDLARPGDQIAISFGLADGGPTGTTTLKLWKIRERG